MIANVSPCEDSYDDTFNTLNYASHARLIKVKLAKNTLKTKMHIANYG